METFSALLAICAGIHRLPVNSPHKDQWRGALMFSLIWAWINGWVNNREDGDLRCHRAHYDVTVMIFTVVCMHITCIQLVIHDQQPSHQHFNVNNIQMSSLFVRVHCWLQVTLILIAGLRHLTNRQILEGPNGYAAFEDQCSNNISSATLIGVGH